MLNVFLPSSLDNSILTSVLVGILVVWAFRRRSAGTSRVSSYPDT